MENYVKVWQLEMMGQGLIFRTLSDLTDALRDDLEEMCSGDHEEIIIRAKEMQEAHLDALPDFEGW